MSLATTRLALVNTLVLLAALAVALVGGMLVRAYLMQLSLDDQLAAEANTYAQSFVGGTSPAGATPNVDLFGPHPIFLEVAGDDGTVLARSANLGNTVLPVQRVGYDTIVIDGHRVRSYVTRVNAAVVQAASPMDDAPPGGPVLFGIVAGLLVGVIASAAVGVVLARVALQPVESLANTADAIVSTEDLSRRIPTAIGGPLRLEPVQRLQVAFNAMLDRLELASQDLQRALAAQRQFVADASHQLRTPLTTVGGNIQLLSRVCAEDCPEPAVDKHLEILADMSTEADRMGRLVNDLLVLARADAQLHLVLERVQIAPILERAYRAATRLSERTGVRLTGPPADVWIMGDADRLHELLTILLENAVRYTPQGGQVLLSSAVESRHAQPGVVLEVADSGPGVAPEERERIFERFYRTSQAQRNTEGFGLGLSIARWIVDEHHGEISVEAASPTGSVFRVWLPTI
jgi:two-component system, OmpR family, sensor kinase